MCASAICLETARNFLVSQDDERNGTDLLRAVDNPNATVGGDRLGPPGR